MEKVCIIIRVYNRIEDLKYCIDIIKDTWKSNDYFIIVVANGKKDGFLIDADTVNKIDLLIEIENNIGHFSGNSQLLLAGLPHIPSNCDYTIILEADTWLYQDQLITKYVDKLEAENAVWASAQFFRYVANLATDFAIVKTSFLKTHDQIFVFTGTPEYYVAKYLKEYGFKYLYIIENMPVSMPRYLTKYPYAITGRFFTFIKGKMITHHIEKLNGGMNEKKFYFNLIADKEYFNVPKINRYWKVRVKINFFMLLSYLIPYKSWFIKTQL